jgi:hypothetical protein
VIGAFLARSPLAVLALLVCTTLAACGGSHQPAALHTPTSVCRHAQKAAAAIVGPTALRIVHSDAADIECALSAGSLKIDVVAQASPRAWEQFDTVVVHQAQAFAGSGSPPRKDLPQDVAGLGYNAAWIPSSREFVATNGTQSSGGSFVTVTLTPRSPRPSSGLKVAKAVASATLAAARAPAHPPPEPFSDHAASMSPP